MPTRGLLAVETMPAIIQWLANLNIKRNILSMFVNKKHHYLLQNVNGVPRADYIICSAAKNVYKKECQILPQCAVYIQGASSFVCEENRCNSNCCQGFFSIISVMRSSRAFSHNTIVHVYYPASQSFSPAWG